MKHLTCFDPDSRFPIPDSRFPIPDSTSSSPLTQRCKRTTHLDV
ncbi:MULTISPECIES: hypothetical protein [unclassified Moorena]|nr:MULTISPECIES: hypothetical protein [unclassified Moorena]